MDSDGVPYRRLGDCDAHADDGGCAPRNEDERDGGRDEISVCAERIATGPVASGSGGT